jgi:hypothetical protein
MNVSIRWFIGLVTFALVTTLSVFASDSARPARLAVLSTDPQLASAADLLTVELSKNPAVTLLERDQIEKVYHEQSLSAGNRDFLKLGQLLGADGLLLLDLRTEGTNQFVEARLVAVKPGVVLLDGGFEWPLSGTEWAGDFSSHLVSYYPKLGVLARDAVPISVIGLHSALQSMEGSELERSLTALAIERLSRQRELFVLERRKMESLSAEKELKDMGDSGFWSGSYVFDGVIDRDSYSPDTMTIDVQLTPPGGAPIAIRASGRRIDPGEVIDRLAEKIALTLKLQVQGSWNPAQEAERFFDEARWAIRWGLFRQAEGAAESSWVLGKQTPEVAALRIRAYKGEAADDRGMTMFGPAQGLVNFEKRPDPESLVAAIRESELYVDAFRRFAADNPHPDLAWHYLGLEVLESGSALLEHYYYAVEDRDGHQEPIAALRNSMRSVARLAGEHPAYTNLFAPPVLPPGVDWSFQRPPDGQNFLSIKAQSGRFWWETPEEELAMYRGIVDAGLFYRVRRRFPGNAANAVLAGWNWENRKRIPVLWEGFIRELEESTNASTRIDGLYLRCVDAWSIDELGQALSRLTNAIAGSEERMFADGRADDFLEDLRSMMRGHADLIRSTPLETNVWPQFETNFIKARVVFFARQRDAAKAVAAQLLDDQRLALLREAKPVDSREFQRLFGLFKITASNAVIYLPLVQAYHKRMQTILGEKPAVGSETNDRERLLARRLIFAVQMLETDVYLKLHPESDAGRPRRKAPWSDQVFTNRPAAASVTVVDPMELSASNPIRVTRFWAPAVSEFSAGLETRLSTGCYRDGRFWVQTSGLDSSLHDGAVFYAVDLSTFSTETIRVSSEMAHLQRPNYFGPTDRHFEVYKDSLYLGANGKVRKYSLQTKKWQDFDAPIQGDSRIGLIDGRLFVTTDDSILEMTPEGKQIRILASSRRRPALTALDALSGYRCPAILKGPEGSVITAVAGKWFELRKGAAEWTPLSVPAEFAGADLRIFDQGVIGLASHPGDEAWLFDLPAASRSPELLFYQPPLTQDYASGIPRVKPPSDPASVPQPRWPLPENVRILGDHSFRGTTPAAAICPDQNGFWIFCGGPKPGRDGRHGVIFFVTPGQARSRSIPVMFELPDHRVNFAANRLNVFEATPRGLVVSVEGILGFWLIPKSDLEGAGPAIPIESTGNNDSMTVK